MQDPAFVVSAFIRSYTSIWDRYFPKCARRAHWQIAQLVRMSDSGEIFSVVSGHTHEIFGMDQDTCILRTKELINTGLITAKDDPIRASTILVPTPTLIESYDHHVLEAVQLLYDTARSLDPALPRLGGLSPGITLDKLFCDFFAAYRNVHNGYRERFLKDSPRLKGQRALQVKAQHALITYAYWYIFITAWTHRHEEGEAKRHYLLIDDFHPSIHEHTDVLYRATSGYVQDLLDWGFLERLRREDGVPKGQFAVRMPHNVFDFFREAFVAGREPIVDAAWKLSRLSANESTSSGTAAIVGFPPVGSRENVSETSPNIGAATTSKNG